MQQRRGEGGRDGVGETCAEKARVVIGEVRLWWRNEGVKMLAGTGVCVVVCCSVLQCAAVCCSLLQCMVEGLHMLTGTGMFVAV